MSRFILEQGQDILDELFMRYGALEVCKGEICQAVNVLLSAFKNGNKLMLCGNGGSAADSEHIVGELMKSFKFDRELEEDFKQAYYIANGIEVPKWLEGSLPAISLVSQAALLTAFGNDGSWTGVFAQQVLGYSNPGDVLFCISTSGNSSNVIEAARVARAKHVHVVSLTGANDSILNSISDVCVRVPQTDTFKIQELHLPIYHAICAVLEKNLFREKER